MVTPFVLEGDGGDKILVNRGWIPGSFAAKDKTNMHLQKEPSGLLRGGEVVGGRTPGENTHFSSMISKIVDFYGLSLMAYRKQQATLMVPRRLAQ